jgi:hypothetical protein
MLMRRWSRGFGWMVLWLVYYPVRHQVHQWEGTGFAAWCKTVAGMAFVMGLDVDHGWGCRVQRV